MEAFNNIYRPKVSVIIPVYNVKQYVADALESVVNQTYKNIEIIVVDDGSNDGSENICDEYAQKYNRIKLIHQENRGLSAARNKGLDNMTGEYVAFLDADDVFLLNAIEKSLNAMLTNSVDCVVFKRIVCKTSKKGKPKNLSRKTIIPKMLQGLYSRKEILNAIADKKLNITVWNKLYKGNIWNNLRFPEGKVFEDLSIIFQIFDKTNNIYIMDDVLVCYRIRKDSITACTSVKKTKDIIDARFLFYNYIETHTPEIFNFEQLQKVYENEFSRMILNYVKILSSHIIEKEEILKLNAKEIKNYEKKIKMENCRIVIKLIYYTMFNYPELLSIFFIPCFRVYKYIKKILQILQKLR